VSDVIADALTELRDPALVPLASRLAGSHRLLRDLVGGKAAAWSMSRVSICHFHFSI
jgi:hypothetical protein